MEQQRPCTDSGMPHGLPAALVPQLHGETHNAVAFVAQHAATAEESTPPDMATAMVGADIPFQFLISCG